MLVASRNYQKVGENILCPGFYFFFHWDRAQILRFTAGPPKSLAHCSCQICTKVTIQRIMHVKIGTVCRIWHTFLSIMEGVAKPMHASTGTAVFACLFVSLYKQYSKSHQITQVLHFSYPVICLNCSCGAFMAQTCYAGIAHSFLCLQHPSVRWVYRAQRCALFGVWMQKTHNSAG